MEPFQAVEDLEAPADRLTTALRLRSHLTISEKPLASAMGRKGDSPLKGDGFSRRDLVLQIYGLDLLNIGLFS
jgi:hypothetical protein